MSAHVHTFFFFFNDTPTTEIYTLSLHDALPISVESLSEPVSAEFAREFQLSTIHSPIPQAFIDRAVLESLKLPARVWRELMKGMLATEPAIALGRTGIPTLVMRGEKDMYATAALQPPLLDMVRSARLV